MTATLHLGRHEVRQAGEPIVIAEIGVNHNGDERIAHRLIDAVAGTGADIVKFQVFDPAAVVASSAPAAAYQTERAGYRHQHQMLSDLALPEGAWVELAQHAHAVGLTFLATAFDVRSADLLEAVNVPAFKVPSGEIDNLPFIRDLAARGRPLLISTGMATLAEVKAAVEASAQAPGVALFHCVTAYPAPLAECNLAAISTMHASTGVPVGWSDHTRGCTSAIAAAALGAALFEKHVTLERTMNGPDHAASSEVDELSEYVTAVRDAHAAMGSGCKVPTAAELPNIAAARRSPHTTRALPAGHRLTAQDVAQLRPAAGLPASADVLGHRLAVDVPAGKCLLEEDIAWAAGR